MTTCRWKRALVNRVVENAFVKMRRGNAYMKTRLFRSSGAADPVLARADTHKNAETQVEASTSPPTGFVQAVARLEPR